MSYQRTAWSNRLWSFGFSRWNYDNTLVWSKFEKSYWSVRWAEIFIADEFKYNPLLSPLTVKFPFRSNLTNTWFQLPTITDEEKENNDDLCHVNIINLVTKELHVSRDAHFTLSDFVSQGEENIVLFHGTDHQCSGHFISGDRIVCWKKKARF